MIKNGGANNIIYVMNLINNLDMIYKMGETWFEKE